MTQHPISVVKIKSSTVLFGGYEYESYRSNELRQDFLALGIKKINDSDTLFLQLSFKHICKVEFLNNSEDKGAGLVIHVNSFMAGRIQDTLDKGGTRFSNYTTAYAPDKFIVLDILNCNPQTIQNIHSMLERCERYHRDYVVEQCNQSKKCADISDSLPREYVSIIYFNQWKALLGSMQKDVDFEYIDETTPDHHEIVQYTVGRICPYRPAEVCSIQQDGSVISRKRINDKSLAHTTTTTRIIPAYSIPQAHIANHYNHQPVFSPHLQSQQAYSGPMLRSRTIVGTEKLSAEAKQLVNTVWNSTEAEYPLEEKCAEAYDIILYRKDLLKLRADDWVNDEIINFYLAMLVDRSKKVESLPKVYAFNSFFYRTFADKGFKGVKKWTKSVDIFSYDILLIPIHQDVHWSLVIIDLARELLEFYDSILAEGGPLLELFRSYLVDEYADKKQGTLDVSNYKLCCRTDIPTQENDYDCGIFVCRFAECTSRRGPINFSQEDMSHYRAQMTYEICSMQVQS